MSWLPEGGGGERMRVVQVGVGGGGGGGGGDEGGGCAIACDCAFHVLRGDFDAHCPVKNLEGGGGSHELLDSFGCFVHLVVRVRILHAHFLHRFWREQRPDLKSRVTPLLQHTHKTNTTHLREDGSVQTAQSDGVSSAQLA